MIDELFMQLRETAGSLWWMEDGLCLQVDPDMFFGDEDNGSFVWAEDAKKVCGLCPVKAECRAYALDDVDLFGVWGGTTEHDRRKIRASRLNLAA